MAKIDLQQDRVSRIRSFVKEDRGASMTDVAKHFGIRKREVEDALRPSQPVSPIIGCQAPYCLFEGRFGTPRGFFCYSHQDYEP